MHACTNSAFNYAINWVGEMTRLIDRVRPDTGPVNRSSDKDKLEHTLLFSWVAPSGYYLYKLESLFEKYLFLCNLFKNLVGARQKQKTCEKHSTWEAKRARVSYRKEISAP